MTDNLEHPYPASPRPKAPNLQSAGVYAAHPQNPVSSSPASHDAEYSQKLYVQPHYNQAGAQQQGYPQVPQGYPQEGYKQPIQAYPQQDVPQDYLNAPQGTVQSWSYAQCPSYNQQDQPAAPAAAAKKKSKTKLLILILVLVVTLATAGVLTWGFAFGGFRGGASSSVNHNEMVTTLSMNHEPQIVQIDNKDAMTSGVLGDLVLFADASDLWAYDINSEQEVWRLPNLGDEMGCEPWSSGEISIVPLDSPKRVALIACLEQEQGTTSYATVNERGQLLETSENSMGGWYQNVDGNLVICSDSYLTLMNGMTFDSSFEKWSVWVDRCGSRFYLVGDYLLMGDNISSFGLPYSTEDGSAPEAFELAKDWIEEDADSMTGYPLSNGNFMLRTDSIVVMINHEGEAISEKYSADDYRYSFDMSGDGVLYNQEAQRAIYLDPNTGEELWNSEDGVVCVQGMDSKYIWGLDKGCDGDAFGFSEFKVVYKDAGEPAPFAVEGIRPDVYRTLDGLIFEEGNQLTAYVGEEEAWTLTLDDRTQLHNGRLYTGDRVINGYLK